MTSLPDLLANLTLKDGTSEVDEVVEEEAMFLGVASVVEWL